MPLAILRPCGRCSPDWRAPACAPRRRSRRPSPTVPENAADLRWSPAAAALVAVVMDGISSAEPNAGTSRPLKIRNWCPARPDGSERRMPPGIEDGYRTWAGLATANGQHPQTTTWARGRPGHRRVPRRAPGGRRRARAPLQLRRRDGQPARHVQLHPIRRAGHLPGPSHVHRQPGPAYPVHRGRVAVRARGPLRTPTAAPSRAAGGRRARPRPSRPSSTSSRWTRPSTASGDVAPPPSSTPRRSATSSVAAGTIATPTTQRSSPATSP